MRVTICHQALMNGASADDIDVMHQVETVDAGLTALGAHTSILACGLDLAQTANALRTHPPDMVFNLVECLDSRGEMIAVVPSLLDALDIPYTGASAEALFQTSNKLMARQRMLDVGLPVATAPTASWPGRFIVKSVWEHASRGLDAESVVRFESISDQIAKRERKYGGRFFAEAYVEGREFNVSVLGGSGSPQALEVAEIVFEGYAEDTPKIVDYAAKWDTQSTQYHGTKRRFLDREERELAKRLQELALGCWTAFQLNGYARVDFRVAGEHIFIVDVNANPCLSPDAGFAAALNRAGIPFEMAVSRIIEAAAAYRSGSARLRRSSPTPNASIGPSL